MILHFLKTAIRVFYKHKMYSFISLTGLIVAFTVSFLILIYAINELSVNREFENFNRIYRVLNTINSTNTISSLTVKDLAPQIESSIQEIERTTRLTRSRAATKIKAGEQLNDVYTYFVDSDFFEIFQNQSGMSKDVQFIDPYTVIITQKFADRISPNSQLKGEILELEIYGKPVEVKVAEVIKGFSDKSIFQTDVFLSMDLFDKVNDFALAEIHPFFDTFILLDESSSIESIQLQLDMMDKNHFDGLKLSSFSLQPFADFYLNSHRLSNHHYPTGDRGKIQLFFVVASLLLLIAIINYTILATANNLYRQKEFGIRKSFGSDRKLLHFQTLSESLSLALIALPISIILTELLLPAANNFWEKTLDFHFIKNWPIVVIFFMLSIITGLASGAYLSFHISKLNPSLILKPNNQRRQRFTIRQGLIVIQIFIFATLTSFSLLVLKQMDYFQSKPLGYNPDHVIVPQLHVKREVTKNGIDPTRIELFVHEIESHPIITIGSYFGMDIPPFTDATHTGSLATYEEPDNVKLFIPMNGDQGTLQTLGLKLKKGRNFSEGRNDEILLTEKGAKHLGLIDPVGQMIKGDLEIIGIIEDFHSQSFRLDMGPLYLKQNNLKLLEKYSHQLNFAFRFDTQDKDDVKSLISEKIECHFPEYDYKLEFQEDRIKGLYESEQKIAQTVTIGVMLIIAISSMGLFALSLYEAERRIKEIAIRKINGATIKNLVVLLSSDFSKWVILAFVLSCPLSYYFMNLWLDNFIYQTLIPWWIFILTAILALLITWVTISFQSIKAASRNPILSLRND